MSTQNKSKSSKNKNKENKQPTQSSSGVKQQSKVVRFFTILISIIVALGLMLPVAGIGVASCTPAAQSNTGTSNGATTSG